MLFIIGVAALLIVTVIILIWLWYTREQSPRSITADSDNDSGQRNAPIPPPADLLAAQNTAMASTQVADDAQRANTVVATEVRGYPMPTSRDEQLQMMSGNWKTAAGIQYVFDSVDTVADRFVITKVIATPSSVTYTASGWNNNMLLALGSDGFNATFTYEGASMVIQSQNKTILLIRQ